MREQLSAYSTDKITYEAFLKKQRFKHEQQVIIDHVKVVENKKVSSKTIEYRIKSQPGRIKFRYGK